MTVDDLLATCRTRQIKLWSEGDQLRFRAPEGSLDAALLQSLREGKTSLMARLRASGCEPDAEHLHEPFALTPVQAAYVLGRHASFAYGGTACHLYVEYEWPANVDMTRAETAWNACVQRHPMLRSVIEDHTQQRILREVSRQRITAHDLRSSTAAQRQAHLRAVRDRLDHAQHALDVWPVLRPEFTLEPTRSLLHFSVDFALLDFASLQMLLVEWRRRHDDPTLRLPELALSFRDCVLHEQRTVAVSADVARDRAWWWARLPALPGPPELPVRSDALQAPPRFAHAQAQLSSEDWKRLSHVAQTRGISPSGAVLAAFADVIGRWSSTPAFSLNLTVLNRPPIHPQVDQVLGDFTALSLLAVQPTAQENFLQRAQRLGAQMFEDLDHAHCSAVEVLRELARQRGAEAALSPIVFTCGIGSHQQLVQAHAPGAALTTPVYMISQTPQVWLDCQVTDQFGGLFIGWDVREGIFPEGMPQAMLDAFADLLHVLAISEEAWLQIDPLPARNILAPQETPPHASWSVADGGHSFNVATGFWEASLRHPEAVAIVDTQGHLSFAEVALAAAAVRQALAEQGIGAGHRVAVSMPRCAEQLIAVIGVLAAGAAYVPIDRRQPAARQEIILDTAQAAAVLTCDNTPPTTAAPSTPRRPHLVVQRRGAPLRGPLFPPHSVGADDLAYIIFTSGSTGIPKGVMLGHAAVIRTLQAINADHHIGPADRLLCLTELSFDLSVYDLLGATAAGAQLVLPAPDRTGDPSHWTDLMRDHGITLWNSVPAQGSMLMDYLDGEGIGLDADPETQSLPPGPRCVFWSGDWIPTSLPQRWWQRWPESQLFSLGGATEAAIWSIRHHIHTEDTVLPSIPYGRALTGHTVQVLDTLGRECPIGVRGEIYIGGDGLALGYARDPERTRQRFIPHPIDGRRLYRTGDWGRYRGDGSIEFLGREDDQVKILGHRIELAEVDAAIKSHPEVADATTLAEGERSHRRLISFAVPKATRPTAETLRTALQEVTATVHAQVALLDWPSPAKVAAEVQALRLACRASLAHALHQINDEVAPTSASASEIERTQRLLHHWRQLVADGSPESTLPAPQVAWHEFAQQADPRLWPQALRTYLQTSAGQLPEQLRGQVSPASLMFPEGSTHVARAMYTDGLHARALHHGMAQAVANILAREPDREWHVLEIGAGTGAASDHVLKALAARVAAGQQVVYYFSDVSDFFLAEAAQRFRAWPWVRFLRLDMNVSFTEQGLAAQSLDLILSSGALNNARNTPEVLARMREVCGPDAWWVLQDLTGEHPEISVSQALMMEVPADERRHSGALFASTTQWLGWLEADGGIQACTALPQGSSLQLLGYEIFLARVQADTPALSAKRILNAAAQRVPHYMLPGELHVLHHWPQTRNGKIDRKALSELASAVRATRVSEGGSAGATAGDVASATTPTSTPSAPHADTLLDRLVAHWEAVLGLTGLNAAQDFFSAGGDSLMLAQLISRLRKQEPAAQQHPFDRLLRQALSTGTPAAMATFLQTARADAAPQAPARVTEAPSTADLPTSRLYAKPSAPRQAPTEARRQLARPLSLAGGHGIPRVIVHEGLGTLHAYRPILSALGAISPIWGFSVQATEDYFRIPAEHLHATLGRRYAQAIADMGLPQVHLLGYCSGGLLAFEMAKSLVQMNVEVVMLDIVSSHHIPYRIDDELLVLWNYARTLGQSATDGLMLPPPELMANALSQVLEATPAHVPEGALAQALAALGHPPPPVDVWRQRVLCLSEPAEDEAHHAQSLRYQVFRHSVQACQADTTAPYAGPARLFIPEIGNPLIPASEQTLRSYWSKRVLGVLHCQPMRGDHFTCLTPEWVHQQLLGVPA